LVSVDEPRRADRAPIVLPDDAAELKDAVTLTSRPDVGFAEDLRLVPALIGLADLLVLKEIVEEVVAAERVQPCERNSIKDVRDLPDDPCARLSKIAVDRVCVVEIEVDLGFLGNAKLLKEIERRPVLISHDALNRAHAGVLLSCAEAVDVHLLTLA